MHLIRDQLEMLHSIVSNCIRTIHHSTTAHKENGWVPSANVGRICIEPDCRKRAIFGNIEDTKPSYCGAHKEDDMVDLANKNKVCEAKGCSKRATYGPSGGKARFCGPHVPEDEDFVCITKEKQAINEKCAEEECKNKRRFGKSQQGPTVCLDHKDVLGDAAIDFGVKCLNHPGRLASHGISGTVEMTHCKECAEAEEEELDEPLVDLRAIHKKNGLGIRPKKKRKVIYV
jgi:EsV-1-7 cysteine-rich motif